MTINDKQQQRLVHQEAKRIIEALLFSTNEPLSLEKIREVIEPFHLFKPTALTDLIQELKIEYLSRHCSFQIEQIANGYILSIRKEYRSYVDALFPNRRTEKLSPAAIEILAIIAYRSPITRPQIDAIRGVDSSGTIQMLIEKQLVQIVGKLQTAGKPSQYGVTPYFLQYFGIKDLSELPNPGLES